MKLESRISAFIQLGSRLKSLSEEEKQEHFARARSENGWFDPENTARAVDAWANELTKENLHEWTSKYNLEVEVPKIVGIVMAGNIPLVGFHDLMCVLISGHFAAVKLSSQDSYLTRWIISLLLEIAPEFKKSLEIRDKLTDIDAVIATGSDNTARYFEFYFKDIPNIIRKNRSSIAVLTGSETTEELFELGKDIFWYYGLGCRNISKCLIPEGYDPKPFFEAIQSYEPIIHHHKYRNNYDYNKSIYLVNKEPHLDTGFLMWRASDQLVSPISVLFHETYKNQNEIDAIIESNAEKIQCIVGKNYTPFGKAQMPKLWDYADNVDTMKFLVSL